MSWKTPKLKQWQIGQMRSGEEVNCNAGADMIVKEKYIILRTGKVFDFFFSSKDWVIYLMTRFAHVTGNTAHREIIFFTLVYVFKTPKMLSTSFNSPWSWRQSDKTDSFFKWRTLIPCSNPYLNKVRFLKRTEVDVVYFYLLSFDEKNPLALENNTFNNIQTHTQTLI